MKQPTWLTLNTVLAMHEQLVAEHGGSPLVRDRGLLESALAAAKNHFAYGERDLCALATAYANGITRNHPFVDGNKRTAFLTAYTFLGIHGVELNAEEADVVQFVEGLTTRSISEAQFTAWLRSVCDSGRPEKTGARSRIPKRRSRKRRDG